MKFLVSAAGTIGTLAIIVGALFKILHFTGGIELMYFGLAWIIIVLIPLVLIQRYRKKSV